MLIIGAGVAGLYAGYILKSKGINFQILEASSVYGGRVAKLTGFADFPIDLGAEWLHGKNNLFSDLIRKSGTVISLDNSSERYWFNNQLVTSLPADVNIFEGDELPDVSFKDYAVQKGLGNGYDYIVEGLAGDLGADASRISVYWNNREFENWCSGDDDFTFEKTYFDFIDIEIASYVKDFIMLNTPVTEINYSGNQVIVRDSNNNNHTADKVIITVPVSILKSGSIRFIPDLPAEKVAAISKIGMDAGMKVYLKFSEKFYDENIIGGNICAAYADEVVGKSGNDHVLLAFIMGKQAEYLTSLGSNAAIVSALLQELDSMYAGMASAAFVSSYVYNWTTHPFIKGAYSYSTVGMGDARKIAAQPLQDKLFFAGEAMNINGHHQTVFGAAETGYREVINILNSAGK